MSCCRLPFLIRKVPFLLPPDCAAPELFATEASQVWVVALLQCNLPSSFPPTCAHGRVGTWTGYARIRRWYTRANCDPALGRLHITFWGGGGGGMQQPRTMNTHQGAESLDPLEPSCILGCLGPLKSGLDCLTATASDPEPQKQLVTSPRPLVLFQCTGTKAPDGRFHSADPFSVWV